MIVLGWILLALCVGLLCWVVLMYHALCITINEREMWYEPLEPVEFEILDGEVYDDEW